MKRSVVVVAGGKGIRFGSEVPKQFLEIRGKPVLVHSIDRFLDFDAKIHVVVVLPEADIPRWKELASTFSQLNSADVVPGGETRYESVLSGISQIDPDSIVAIHDAVRPCVSKETIARCFLKAEDAGSAIPVIAMEDTVRQFRGSFSEMVDREEMKRVQTPQVFRAKKLLEAYNRPMESPPTDDAAVYESCFGNLSFVEGNVENIKITYPADLAYAECLLRD